LYDQYVRPELAEGTDPNAVIVEGGSWKPLAMHCSS
ncbi:extracellular solute-binding protein, partial [Pseudomonas syringae pv. japonica str. M301072]